ncbi:tetratricopeptide repeat protein [Saccharopolyspora indica]|uniref:tetratricopeptide repeat protein n=1 Tax=Saccharopolyspora indica TaxID=1229659 RepID=UPI0022EAA323|nr:tetratricopeptide repeat protein [Saccharopolyspora indica]MDA3645056.1 tetratricopeptide repeat protein [Saccharopolyspora indica]
MVREPRLDLQWLLDANDRSGDSPALLDRLERATPEEAERALAVLAARAADGSAAALHLHATGLVAVGRVDEAIPVLREAISRAPERTEFRLNLAVAYVRVGAVDLAAATLDAAIAAAEAGQLRLADIDRHQIRVAVQRRRDELTAWIAWRDEDYRMLRLRADMLRERIALGEATTADRVQLANALLALRKAADIEDTMAEATSVLEAAYAIEPGNVGVLERLLYAYGVTHDERFDEVLRQLEQADPNSLVLREFTRSGRDADHAELAATLRARIIELFEIAVDLEQRPEADAAIVGLREMLKSFPANREYLGMLMFAEHIHGESAQASAIAEKLEASVDLTHSEHFNMAQVFWSHDQPRGERHLLAAYDKAANDDERRDVDDLRALLAQWGR